PLVRQPAGKHLGRRPGWSSHPGGAAAVRHRRVDYRGCAWRRAAPQRRCRVVSGTGDMAAGLGGDSCAGKRATQLVRRVVAVGSSPKPQDIAARGESVASHRDGRGASRARRDDREYREYLREEQRSLRGCIARRMQPDFHHGLLEERVRLIEAAWNAKAAKAGPLRSIVTL